MALLRIEKEGAMWNIQAPNHEVYRAAWKILTRVKHLTFTANEAGRNIAVTEDLDPSVVVDLQNAGCFLTLDNSH